MRRNFSSSRLVRLLGDAAPAENDAPGQDVAERLSLWVGVFDAVTLHAAQQPGPQAPVLAQEGVTPVSPGTAAALQAQLHQVQAVLTRAISASDAVAAEEWRSRPPRSEAPTQAAPVIAAAVAVDADFAPHRKRYLDQQRNMELMIAPLREHLRQALAQASPRLRQLAELDAVWERMLEAREQRLLATVPALLKRRFEQLRQTHGQTHGQTHQEGDPAAWLGAFDKALREVLLAELALRLEPVTGLMEAFSKEVEVGMNGTAP